jgi:hypothetical protein
MIEARSGGALSGRVAPVPMIVPNHSEGAPGPLLLGTGDIDAMQALALSRTSDAFTIRPHASHRSAASVQPSISTCKDQDTESGIDYFGKRRAPHPWIVC